MIISELLQEFLSKPQRKDMRRNIFVSPKYFWFVKKINDKPYGDQYFKKKIGRFQIKKPIRKKFWLDHSP
jgi:hypothetical protein